MKAIVYRQYGSADQLQMEDIPELDLKDDEILVKVHSASVNSWDWDLVTGKPRIYRLLFGLFRPRYPVIGSDIAGEVVKVGARIEKFKAGDKVFGDISGSGFGAFAEFARAKENELAPRPETITFDEAAAIPQAGLLALQGIRKAQPKKGKAILINGAGGGAGSLAIQISKEYGMTVTAVDSGDKLDFMRSLGADHVIDYKKEDFSQQEAQYDIILDMISTRPVSKYRRVLKPSGKAVIVGGKVGNLLQVAFLGSLSRKKVEMLAYKPNSEDLAELAEMCESGRIKPVIDRTYPLENVAEAVQYIGDGKVQGKLVIRIA